MNSKILFIKDFETEKELIKEGRLLKVVDQDQDYVYLADGDTFACLTHNDIDEYVEEVKSKYTSEECYGLLNQLKDETLSKHISNVLSIQESVFKEMIDELIDTKL